MDILRQRMHSGTAGGGEPDQRVRELFVPQGNGAKFGSISRLSSQNQDGNTLARTSSVQRHPLNAANFKNPHLANLPIDFLYHLGLDTSMDLKKMFGDTKIICFGGSQARMLKFMKFVCEELHDLMPEIPVGCKLTEIGKSDRFSMYKHGPVVSVNHGIGMPSLSVLLHELAKLFAYAGAEVTFIRLGTSGGLGIEPGTVVVTDAVFNSELQPYHRQVIMGKVVQRPTACDSNLVNDIMQAVKQSASVEGITVIRANTMSTNDFYEEQGRMDGALCEFSEEDRKKFLMNAHNAGIRNIEMEAGALTDFCTRMGIPCAMVCSTLVDRLKGDQVTASPETVEQCITNSMHVVAAYIRKSLETAKGQ